MIFYVWEYMKFGFFGGFTSRSQQAIGAFQKTPRAPKRRQGLRFGLRLALQTSGQPLLRPLGPSGSPRGFQKSPQGLEGSRRKSLQKTTLFIYKLSEELADFVNTF